MRWPGHYQQHNQLRKGFISAPSFQFSGHFQSTALKLVIRLVPAPALNGTHAEQVIKRYTIKNRVPCALQPAYCIKLISPLIFRLPLHNKGTIRYIKQGLHRGKAVLTYNIRAFSYLTPSTVKQYPLQAVKETSSWSLPQQTCALAALK